MTKTERISKGSKVSSIPYPDTTGEVMRTLRRCDGSVLGYDVWVRRHGVQFWHVTKTRLSQ